MAASAAPVPLSSLMRPGAAPALPRLLVLALLIAASALSPSSAADLPSPASAPSSLPPPADSPPAPPPSFGSIPSPAPHSGSDSALPPSTSPFHSPPSPPSSEPSPSPSPSLPTPADAPPAPSPAAANSEKLRSTPQAEQQPQDGDDRKGGMSAGKKAGIAVGVLFAAAVAVVAFAVYRKRGDNIRRASRYAGYTTRREMQMQMV